MMILPNHDPIVLTNRHNSLNWNDPWNNFQTITTKLRMYLIIIKIYTYSFLTRVLIICRSAKYCLNIGLVELSFCK